MKLLEEQMKSGLDKAYKKSGSNAYFGEGFKAGIEFAIDTINTQPKTYMNIDCDKCDGIAEYHFCGECLEGDNN